MLWFFPWTSGHIIKTFHKSESILEEMETNCMHQQNTHGCNESSEDPHQCGSSSHTEKESKQNRVSQKIIWSGPLFQSYTEKCFNTIQS